jgi:BASS family bile acid:Na+ symporter
MLFFFGVESFDILGLLVILGELIVVPLALSRLLLFLRAARHIEKWRGPIVDWSLFIIVFTLIGSNRQAFVGDFGSLVRIAAIAVAISFVLGYLLERLCRALRLRRDTSVSVVLIGTIKNYGLSGGLAITLASERAAIPASVCLVFGILFVTWLSFRVRRLGSTQAGR